MTRYKTNPNPYKIPCPLLHSNSTAGPKSSGNRCHCRPSPSLLCCPFINSGLFFQPTNEWCILWIIDMPSAKGYEDKMAYFNSWVENFTEDSSRYCQVVKWIYEYCVKIKVTFERVHSWLIRKWLYLLRKDLPMWTLISAFWSLSSRLCCYTLSCHSF